jgi:vancomycin resistance protein YoaR
MVILLVLIVMLMGASLTIDFDFVLYDGNNIAISKQYSLNISTHAIVSMLFGSNYSKFYESIKSLYQPLTLLSEELNLDVLRYLRAVERPPQYATIIWFDEEFKITDEVDGIVIDYFSLCKNIFYSFKSSFSVALERIKIQPKPSADELLKATRLIGQFSTCYVDSSPNRKHNIHIAVKKINGVVLESAERFSFNEVVGERSLENGYKSATIIENGVFSNGIGGGVCQVSTTLYNAVLLAGLTIERVRCHSLPVVYVPLSFDAMVSTQSDLVFVNNTNYPVYILAKANEKSITFKIFGRSVNEALTLNLRSHIIETKKCNEFIEIIDVNNMLKNNESEKILKTPKCGYVSQGYIDYYKDGKLIRSVKIRDDVYAPQKGRKLVRKHCS